MTSPTATVTAIAKRTRTCQPSLASSLFSSKDRQKCGLKCESSPTTRPTISTSKWLRPQSSTNSCPLAISTEPKTWNDSFCKSFSWVRISVINTVWSRYWTGTRFLLVSVMLVWTVSCWLVTRIMFFTQPKKCQICNSCSGQRPWWQSSTNCRLNRPIIMVLAAMETLLSWAVPTLNSIIRTRKTVVTIIIIIKSTGSKNGFRILFYMFFLQFFLGSVCVIRRF